MATDYEAISEEQRAFIEAQHLFFVASAPLSGEGHVNMSPKGLDSFRVLGPNRVAYLDLTGSGNETSAHLQENGRITFMFCAFDRPPTILRLYGRGRAVLPGDAEWSELAPHFVAHLSMRQIIVAEISLVKSSCGYAVPFMTFAGDRDTLDRWTESKGPEALDDYRRAKNARSIDGLATPLGERSGVVVG